MAIKVDPFIGQTFGEFQRYQIIERVEKRDIVLGAAYRGYDGMARSDVLIYIIQSVSKQRAERFSMEFLRAQKIDDPNLLKVLACEKSGDRTVSGNTSVFIVTSWLEGETLEQRLKTLRAQGLKPGLQEAIELVQQIGCAVETLHLNNLWSRPISPSSILLVRSGGGSATSFWAVLADLGLMNLLDNYQPNLDKYSPVELAYLSPEQLKASDYTPPDLLTGSVYILGVLLYELLIGAVPFQAQTPETATEEKERWLPPPRLKAPALPEVIEQVILTALQYKPEQRYARAGALVAALARALAILNTNPDGTINLDLLKPNRLLPALASDTAIVRQRTTSSNSDVLLVDKEQVKPLPGQPEIVTITVLNRLNQVDHFNLRIAHSPTLPREWLTLTTQNEGRAEINQAARFSLTIRLPARTDIRAGSYSIWLIGISEVRNGEIGRRAISLIVDRAGNYLVDEIYPQLIPTKGKAFLTVHNLGNAREVFRLTLRSENNDIQFEPAEVRAIVDPGEETDIEFCATPRYTPWFGRATRHKIVAQVAIQNVAKLEVKKAEVKVASTFPPLVLVMTALACLGCLLGIVLYHQPTIVSTAEGNNQDLDQRCKQLLHEKFQEKAVAVCWKYESFKHVNSLALLLNPREPEIPVTQTWGIMSQPSAFTYTDQPTNSYLIAYVYQGPNLANRLNLPQVIVRNHWGEQTWLGPLSWLGANYYRLPYEILSNTPTPMPPPLAHTIDQFCVRSDSQEAQHVCTSAADSQPAQLNLVVGEAQTLAFQWTASNVDGLNPVLDPAPTKLDMPGKQASAPVPTTAGQFTYNLHMVDLAGKSIVTSSLIVSLSEIIYTVPITVALHKAPGDIYEQNGILVPQTPPLEVILRSKPVDYTQNTDDKRWVHIFVKQTNEDGWVDFDKLQLAPSTGGSQNPAGNSNNNPGENGQVSAEDQPIGAQGDAGQTPSNPANSSAPDVRLAQLPVEKPAPAATVTPEPTPTPQPTPTPLPTKEPLQISIEVDKAKIKRGECVHLKWTIRGVEKVYFDNGTGEWQAINTNIDHTVEECNLTKSTSFFWKIVIDEKNNIIQTEERKVKVKSQPDE